MIVLKEFLKQNFRQRSVQNANRKNTVACADVGCAAARS